MAESKPETARIPVYIASAIVAVVLTLGSYAFTNALKNVSDASTQGLASLQRAQELGLQLARQEAAAQANQERVLREAMAQQMRDHDAEHERQIRELQNQVAALTLANSETRGILTNLQSLVLELRDAVNRLPLREIPPGPSRRSALDDDSAIFARAMAQPQIVVTAP